MTKRLVSILLAFSMILTMTGVTALATGGGIVGIETPGVQASGTSIPGTELPDGELPAAPSCSCTGKCTAADPENGIPAAIQADCPVCGKANADLTACMGKAPVLAMLAVQPRTGTKPYAIGISGYDTLAAAVAAVTDSTETTIIMEADATETSKTTISDAQNIILDLNGCTLSKAEGTIIEVSGTLTITDTATGGTGSIVGTTVAEVFPIIYAQPGSTLTVSSGTVQNLGEGGYAIRGISSTVTISGTAKIVGAREAILVEREENDTMKRGQLNISGGTVSGSAQKIPNHPEGELEAVVIVQANAGFEMTNGTVTNNGVGYAIELFSVAKATISGGAISNTDTGGAVLNTNCGLTVSDSATLTAIKGDTLTQKGNVYSLTISGGTVENTGTGSAVHGRSGDVKIGDTATITAAFGGKAIRVSGGTTTINGGTITGAGDAMSVDTGGTLTISGGTIRSTGTLVTSAGTLNIKEGTLTSAGRLLNVTGGTTTISETYSGTPTLTGTSTATVNAIDVGTGAILNINDGKISDSGSGIAIKNSGTTTITSIVFLNKMKLHSTVDKGIQISGGTFTNGIVVDTTTGAAQKSVKSLLAPDYTYYLDENRTSEARYGETTEELTATVYVKKAKQAQAAFTFDIPSLEKTYGDVLFTKAATGGSGTGATSYASDVSSVATVDADGKVTILSAGQTTITATKKGDATYGDATASYTLTVKPKELTLNQGSLQVTSKEYDGTNKATLTGVDTMSISVVSGDTVTLDSTAITASYADKEIGTGKAVTVSGYTLGGTSKDNYKLNPTSISLTGHIIQAAGTKNPDYAKPDGALAQLNAVHIITNIMPTLAQVPLPAGWSFTGNTAAGLAGDENNKTQPFAVKYTSQNPNYADVTLAQPFPVTTVAMDVSGGLSMRSIDRGETKNIAPVTIQVVGAALPNSGDYAESNIELRSALEKIATISGKVGAGEKTVNVTGVAKGLTMVGLAYANSTDMLGYILIQVNDPQDISHNDIGEIKDIGDTLERLVNQTAPSAVDRATVNAVAGEITKLHSTAQEQLKVGDVAKIDAMQAKVQEIQVTPTVPAAAVGVPTLPTGFTVVGAAVSSGAAARSAVAVIAAPQPVSGDVKLKLALEMQVNTKATALQSPLFFQMELPDTIDISKLTIRHVLVGGSEAVPFTSLGGQRISFKMMSFSGLEFIVGSGGSGSTGSTGQDSRDNFWERVEQQIEDSKKDDVVTADAKGQENMPASIIQRLIEEGKGLVIHWSGGDDIVIPAGKVKKPEPGRVYYPLSYLAELYKNYALIAPINPETGGYGYYDASLDETVPVLGQLREAVAASSAPYVLAGSAASPAAAAAKRVLPWATITVLLAALAVVGSYLYHKGKYRSVPRP